MNFVRKWYPEYRIEPNIPVCPYQPNNNKKHSRTIRNDNTVLSIEKQK